MTIVSYIRAPIVSPLGSPLRSGLPWDEAGGGSAPWSPLADPDLVLWLDAGLSARTESTGAIDQLNDLSGRGYHATATLTTRPVYSATGIGGAYPCVTFDGTNDYMLTPALAALAGATGCTVFMLLKDASASARYLLEYGASGGTSGSGSFGVLANITNANSITCYTCGNVGSNYWRSAAASEDLVTHKMITFGWDFTAAAASEVNAIRSNGAALSGAQTGASNNSGAMASLVLGVAAQINGASPQALSLGALIIVKRAMTDAEKLVFERYLGGRFGLPFSDEMATRATPRILWLGQSNAMGELDAYATIEGYDGPHTNPLIYAYKDWYSGAWFTSTWSGLTENPGLGWEGPDLPAAITLVRDYDKAPEIIMCARGATSLAVDWEPTAGTTYARLRDVTYPTAVATHPAAPATPAPWVVWIQGENDASSAPYAAAYEANLPAFFVALGTDIPAFATAKIALVQLHIDSRNGAATETTVGQVRTAQQAYAAANPTRVFLIDVDDLALRADSVHFTETTAIEVGKRIATVIGSH